MGDPAKKKASYADLEALPSNVVGEILFGVLHAFPRPRVRHGRATSRLGNRLGPPFDEGSGGPGGWILLDEPEVHLGEDVVVPDLAGWRRERMPELPDVAFFTLAPDWVCETLSPSTRTYDITDKRAIYQRERVQHLWFVDPDARTLEVQRHSESGYITLSTWRDDAEVRAEPFEAVVLPLGVLWAR
ncbi:MAG: Uma2 family endonuclease [Polyangiaceae bacterium]|nr:Uma2 family endonuclease [Polyangiaceae bacterium]